MASAALALPPAAPPTRPRVLLVGTALASAATAMQVIDDLLFLQPLARPYPLAVAVFK